MKMRVGFIYVNDRGEDILLTVLFRIDDILWMLHQNGQIIDGWIVEKHNSSYIANVVTTDDDSLDKKYFCNLLQNIPPRLCRGGMFCVMAHLNRALLLTS